MLNQEARSEAYFKISASYLFQPTKPSPHPEPTKPARKPSRHDLTLTCRLAARQLRPHYFEGKTEEDDLVETEWRKEPKVRLSDGDQRHCSAPSMACEMWTLKYLFHDPGPTIRDIEEIDRDYICYLDIKEKMKSLGGSADDRIYYENKGANNQSEMVEIVKDACVSRMLDEFGQGKSVNIHVLKVMPTESVPNEGGDEEVGDDETYDDPGEYWKKLSGELGLYDDSDSDDNFDVEKETTMVRKHMAEMKKKEMENRGKYSEEEDNNDDLYDVTEGLDKFDIDDIALPQTQMEKEMAFAREEEARQKKEKVDRKKLANERRKKKQKSSESDLSDPPSSDDGSDLFHNGTDIYEYRSDEEKVGFGRKRRRPRRLLTPRIEYDEDHLDNLEQMDKGVCFRDVKQFRKVVKEFHIVQGRNFAYLKNKMDKIKLHCLQEGCNFYIFASKISREPTFMIRDEVVHHSCGRTRESSRISSTWLAKHYESYFRSDPNWKVSAFIDCVKREMNFEITKRMAYRARWKASNMVLGNHVTQYHRLRDYMHNLILKNPGSKAVVLTEPRASKDVNPVFSSLFVSFHAQIQGFLDGCRPFIGLDGCFVKLANGAQVLAASARDGNNNMFPLAFSVVNKEDTDNWTWFLHMLQSAIGLGEKHGGWTFMSDRQKGLLSAIAKVFPNCEHRYCKRHVLANFANSGFKGKIYKEFFDKIVYACTPNEYNFAMEELKKYDVEAWKWVAAIPKEHISRHAFSTRSKSDLVVNNLSEVFNKYILDYRDKPIKTMMELVRTRIMTRMSLKRSGLDQLGWDITPVMAEKLEKAKSRSKYSTAHLSDVGIYQVNSVETSYEVNLINKTCGCYLFQLTGVPCHHACAAIFKAKERPENYVDAFFKKDAYKAAYANAIYPVPHEAEWVKTNSANIDPPLFTRQPGRPKKNRIKGADEEPSIGRARKGTVTCGNCKGDGHNMKGCDKPLRPFLALRVRKHVPLTPGTQESAAPPQTTQHADPSQGSRALPQRGRGRETGRGRGRGRSHEASQDAASSQTTQGSGKGRGRGRGTSQASQEAPSDGGRGRARGRANFVDTRVYGTTRSGRKASRFNIIDKGNNQEI